MLFNFDNRRTRVVPELALFMSLLNGKKSQIKTPVYRDETFSKMNLAQEVEENGILLCPAEFWKGENKTQKSDFAADEVKCYPSYSNSVIRPYCKASEYRKLHFLYTGVSDSFLPVSKPAVQMGSASSIPSDNGRYGCQIALRSSIFLSEK